MINSLRLVLVCLLIHVFDGALLVVCVELGLVFGLGFIILLTKQWLMKTVQCGAAKWN